MGKELSPISVGVDIGGTNIKIGIVEGASRLTASAVIPTVPDTTAKKTVEDMSRAILCLLAERGLQPAQCAGIGMGIPGTIDKRAGVVRYSNNLQWEDIPIVERMKEYFSLPVQAANDADCAALGELAAGAGKGFQNMIMITLGTGVGGGIILNGKLFSGACAGGSELGHMVIVENGAPCTCGRAGCLEAYVSATALKRIAKQKTGRDMLPEQIFDGAKNDDMALRGIVEDYIKKLGTGIVNMANIFRPQLILLGGGLCAQGETLLRPLRTMVEKECFGGVHGELPEVKTAVLGNQAGMLGAANLLQA